MQPGDTIHPDQTVAAQPDEQPMTVPAPQVVSTPVQAPVEPPVVPAVPEEPEEPTQPLVPQNIADGSISWHASEYVEHQKAPGWYMILGLAALVIVVVVYLLTKDILSTVVIGIGAVLFGMVAARPPRTLDFVINSSGISIAGKLYSYEMFKTFSIIEDGAIHSIQLLPLKRFMPPLSLYYPPEQEDAVIQTLSMYVPYQDAGHDMFDRLMSRIRF